jgi:predicted NodU family carbamoyl transferase
MSKQILSGSFLLLLNTSFNLAGEPLAETIQDAVDVLHRSELKYIYLPEINFLLFK